MNLGGRESNDLVWRDVNISEQGRFRIVYSCSSPEARTFHVQLDDGERRFLECPATGGKFEDVPFVTELGKGVHSIRLSNATAFMPDVDCMSINPDAEKK